MRSIIFWSFYDTLLHSKANYYCYFTRLNVRLDIFDINSKFLQVSAALYQQRNILHLYMCIFIIIAYFLKRIKSFFQQLSGENHYRGFPNPEIDTEDRTSGSSKSGKLSSVWFSLSLSLSCMSSTQLQLIIKLAFDLTDSRKEKSLGLLAQQFIKLFVCSKVNWIRAQFHKDSSSLY